MDQLSPEKQQKTTEFMQISHIEDIQKAVHFMEMSNFDIGNALNLFLEHGDVSPPQQQQHQNNFVDNQPNLNDSYAQFENNNQDFYSDLNPQQLELLNQYKTYLQSEQGDSDGFVHCLGKFFKSIYLFTVPIFIRGLQPGGEEFIYKLNDYKIDTQIQFSNGSVEDFRKQQKQDKNKALLIFVLNEQKVQRILQLFQNDQIVKYLNKEFICLGILQNSEEYQQIQQQIGTNQNIPCFTIFRNNLLNKLELLDIIQVQEESPIQFYLDKFANATQQLRVLQQQDELIHKRVVNVIQQDNRIRQYSQQQEAMYYQNQLINNFMGNQQQQQPQQNVNRSNSLEQERILRQEQERAYEQMQQEQLIEQKQQQEEQQAKIQQEQEKEIKQVQMKSKIEDIKSKIKEEPQGSENIIQLAFRLDNGSKIFRKFEFKDSVQQVFDYVYQNEEVEFEQEHDREFDLIQTYPRISLYDKKDQTLEQVFPGSNQEILIVKEL